MKQKQTTHFEDLALILRQCEKYIQKANRIIAELNGKTEQTIEEIPDGHHFQVDKYPNGEEVIEGIFDGMHMIGPDGSQYQVPENYASKSKLVEGDALKLTITKEGRYVYKQIGPLEREHKRGVLIYHQEEDQYRASVDGSEYKLLKASVTFYKAEAGDEIIVILPKNLKTSWAAFDSVIKELPSGTKNDTQKEQSGVSIKQEITKDPKHTKLEENGDFGTLEEI